MRSIRAIDRAWSAGIPESRRGPRRADIPTIWDRTAAAWRLRFVRRDRRPTGGAMSTERNKDISKRFTDLFSTGDEKAAEAILADDVVFHGGSAGELQG